MRIFIMTLALIAMTAGISACNTMEGAGQDIQAGGKKLERSADKHKGDDSRNYH
ncbi:MAG: entericidin A/B family lipoprotein [Proteobacteria bacterium]|nr:entericidin A/B family lipoprotein [Pseudomonadota bacterium]